MSTQVDLTTPLDSAQRGPGPFVWRFPLYHRVTHAAVMISFFLLAATGLPLRFSCAPWAPLWIKLFGGVEMAGLLHRIGGVITFGYFGAHIAYLAYRFSREKDKRSLLWGPDSMVPQPRDATDMLAQFRWFFGLGPKPVFGRFSYMEKFDYFAVFWGVAIIGGSGLMLWFPEFFAGFVPGWMFNLAAIVHADEAILAMSFIFTIHFFNVHLRPEKFPLDAVMFTGRATVHYMAEEHGQIIDRIEAHLHEAPSLAQIPDTPAPPPTRNQSLIAAVFGFIALGIGLLLAGMMLWVALC
jgi:cytochrome b subunit of formate dehydrogenase